jgi:DNA-binding CsgD family transcriptional regulator
VLRLVAAGQSNRQIADALDLERRSSFRHRRFSKLGADNHAATVALAAERGLLSGR